MVYHSGKIVQKSIKKERSSNKWISSFISSKLYKTTNIVGSHVLGITDKMWSHI